MNKSIYALENAQAVGDAVGVDWQTTSLEDFRTSWAIVMEFTNDPTDGLANEADSLQAGRLAKRHLEFLNARNRCYHELELRATKGAWMRMIPVHSEFRLPDSFFIKGPDATVRDAITGTLWH